MESPGGSLLEPKAIFFVSPGLHGRRDWESCFYLKAAAVYGSIVANTQQADAVVDMSVASSLLISTATNCATPDGAESNVVNVEDKGKETEIKNEAEGKEIKAGTPHRTVEDKGKETEIKNEAEGKETEIKNEAEGKEIKADTPHRTGDVLQRLPVHVMEAVDAIYLLVAILHDLKDKSGRFPDREEMDAHCASGRRRDALLDAVKARNQVPLSVLRSTLKKFPEGLKAAADSLMTQPSAGDDGGLITAIKCFNLSFDDGTFDQALRVFCWYFSPLYKEKIDEAEFSPKENLLGCLHSSLVDAGDRNDRKPVAPPLPGARHLARCGLGFGATSDGKVGARFFEPRLHLPAVVFDAKLETVVANLMAWERKEEEERPVARYFMLLRELVRGEDDVGVLARAGVLMLRGQKEGEVAQLLRRLEESASCPLAYSDVDDEVVKMAKAEHGREERRASSSRPGVTWASAAVALLSVLTAAILARRRRKG